MKTHLLPEKRHEHRADEESRASNEDRWRDGKCRHCKNIIDVSHMQTTRAWPLTSHHIREANAADGAPLADLLFHSPHAGRMVLGQDRSRDVFARRRPYDASVTFVIEGDRGDILATLSAATKTVLLSGSAVTAVFLFDLAVASAARRAGHALRMLDDAERWARERGAAFTYCHLLGGNAASLKTFRATGHCLVRELVSLAYPVPENQAGPLPGARPIDDWSGSAEVLRTSLAAYNLVRPLGGADLQALWTSLPGFRAEDVWFTGRAVLGIWDYSTVARAIPLQLPIELRVLSAGMKLARSLGLPLFAPPELGRPLSYGLLLGGAGDDRELRTLFRAALGRARERGIDVVVLFRDSRVRLPWTRASVRATGSYLLMVKPLEPRVLERLEERPVWVDSLDL